MLETGGANTENPLVQFKKATLIGVGLLGGSLGLALRERRLARNVTGFVRRARSVRECLDCGAVDVATLDLAEAVRGADLIVLCTPLAQMGAIVRQFIPHLKRGALVTDVGSVKASVVGDVESLISRAGAHFVASHPMAGSEKTGVLRRPGRFVCERHLRGHPHPEDPACRPATDRTPLESCRVEHFAHHARKRTTSWSAAPAICRPVAAALANFVLDPEHSAAQGALCANGFRDTTRIASGSPEMWRDIAAGQPPASAQSTRGLLAASAGIG